MVSTLNEDIESYLQSSTCVWLLGIERFDCGTERLVRHIRASNPNVKVVLITASQTAGEILRALYAGASGFACQDISGDQLIKSLELIMLGQTVVYPQFCKLASSQQGVAGNDEMAACDVPNAPMGLDEGPSKTGFSKKEGPSKTGFSKKEVSILRALMDGASNKVIAQKLVITESTVKVHMKAILRKLRLHNRTQAALWARQYLQLDGI